MKNSLLTLITIIFISFAFSQSVDVKDGDSNTLMQINDEGTTGSVTLPASIAPSTTTNKLYNVGSTLHWNGRALGSGGSSLWSLSDGNIYYNLGNVGIGTETPQSKLSVGGDGNGTVTIYGETDDGYGVYGRATGSEGYGYGVHGEANGTYGKGVVGHSWHTGTSYDFDATGFGIDYGSTSSIRWKRNIIEIENPLEKLAELRGVYFNWDEEHGGGHDVGMIAEEVGKVLPEIVVYEENGIDADGMDYSKLTPLLVEVAKAQQKLIEELQARIEVLERK